jgi:hypothetical protein
MFEATVTFRTRIKSIEGNVKAFPVIEFTPNEPGVGKVTIEAPNGDEIRATVYLPSVASHDDGRARATTVYMDALNRIVFNHDLAIEDTRCMNVELKGAINPSVASANCRFKLAVLIDPARLKTELEQAPPPGGQYYGLFREARQSLGYVEEFMHLYHILLMLNNDDQADIDAFIKHQEPGVRETPQPPIKRKRQRKTRQDVVMETVYTRLRNEFGHKRACVDLERTKSEMEEQLPRLIALTKQAIEQHP